MILTRTPFRISFFGGGTDYPVWFEKNGGAVLSTTIDKYCYILCRSFPPFFDNTLRVVWSKVELTNNAEDLEHPGAKGVLKFLNIKDGVEVHHAADLPARSGLGASSAFTVGLLNALYALSGKPSSKASLALDAITVEQDIVGENVGSQDQVAAAHGGFNVIRFKDKRDVHVEPLNLSPDITEAFRGRLMLFFTGLSRSASQIAAEQIKNTGSKERELRTMLAMVDEAVVNLKKGDIDSTGRMLHESWQLKKGLSRVITNSHIDQIYEAGMQAGALGGKLLGAGGGGFILFYADPRVQPKIRERLKDLLYVPFGFDTEGSKLIYGG
jgi:D-glycero-alpha-D-manno-heptose-7-phosphate kinase